MGNVVVFQDRPLVPRRAMERIKQLWASGLYDWGYVHAEEQMVKRGLDNLDVENVVRYGQVTSWSKPGSHWRYRVDGRSVEQDEIAVVFELRKDEMTVVTVMCST